MVSEGDGLPGTRIETHLTFLALGYPCLCECRPVARRWNASGTHRDVVGTGGWWSRREPEA